MSHHPPKASPKKLGLVTDEEMNEMIFSVLTTPQQKMAIYWEIMIEGMNEKQLKAANAFLEELTHLKGV